MTMDVPNFKEELKLKRKALVRVFNREITDPNIRKFIFNKDVENEGDLLECLVDTKAYPLYFKNILALSFYYVYACYRYDLDNKAVVSKGARNHVALRIRKYLDETLFINPITMELMDFVLADVQNELSFGAQSNLKPMLGRLGNFDQGFSFRPMLKVVIDYERTQSRFEGGRLEMTALFLDIVSNLTFLKNYCLLEETPCQFRFVTHLCKDYQEDDDTYEAAPYDELWIEHLLLRADDRFYRLYSIEKGEKGDEQKQLIVRLRYLALKDDRPMLFTVPQAEGEEPHHLSDYDPRDLYEYIVANELDPHQPMRTIDQNTVSIGQIHAINYKYLKHLALAISDTLSSFPSGRTALVRKFSKKYPYIFEQRGSAKDVSDSESRNDLDWDSVIIMLLIEVSPTSVLETIIRTDTDDEKRLFCALGRDLYKRVYEAESLSLFRRSSDEIIATVRQVIKTKLILGEAGGFGKLPIEKMYTKLFPRAAAMLLLSLLNHPSEQTQDEGLSYTGNLSHNITFLKKEREEGVDPEKTIRYASIILGETLKHIMCFYAGLEEYGKEKAKFDTKTRYHFIPEKEIHDIQKKLSKQFLKAAGEQAEQLAADVATNPAEVMALLKQFVDFCQRYSQTEDAAASKNLSIALGRFEVVDTSRFKALARKLQEASTQNTRESAVKWVDITLDILEFFKTGSTPDVHMEGDLLNAVYPFTAVFNKGRENPDGYKTITFSLNIDPDDEDKGHEINVLSEFRYDHNEVYYCLPNVIRSNFKWWIDPVLISFRDFNRIFEDIRKEED